MWTSINKKFILFLGIIFGIGIISGIFYFSFLSGDDKNIIISSITNFFNDLSNIKINFIGTHLIILPLLWVLSLIVIGIPLALFYLFYNGFLIGFTMSNFVLVAHFKGFIFGLIYVLITKVIFLFFLLIFIISTIRIGLIVLKKEKLKKEKIYVLSKRVLLCFILILINDLILYFLGDNLINVFNFLVI